MSVKEQAAPLIVGVSGLRGILGESLTPEVAVRYAGAFGTWMNGQLGDREAYILIGRDGRAGGEAIYEAAIAGLLGCGVRVGRLGVVTTPTVGVCCDEMEADGAMIVTASHNPQEWNGLKTLVRTISWEDDDDDAETEGDSDACAPGASFAGEIVEAFEDGEIEWAGWEDAGESVEERDAVETHLDCVTDALEELFEVENFWDLFDDRDEPVRVVVDAVNASAPRLNRAFFEGTPAHMIQLHGEATGLFPHVPEPTAENLSGDDGLCGAVTGLRAAVGFAQDPDADRLAIVDEHGRYIGEEYTLALAAESVLSAYDGDDAAPVLVVNLSTSRMIDDVAREHGAEVVRTPVGEAHVVSRMKALMDDDRDVVLGGEGNGGVILPLVSFVRDSVAAMGLVLGLMARTGLSVAALVDRIDSYSEGGAGYAIVKRKVPIATKADAQPACQAVEAKYADQRVDHQDGVRVDFDPLGDRAGAWVHVRASNTEPIMRLICEAPSEGLARDILSEVEAVIGGA